MADTRFRPYELAYLLSGNLEESAATQEGANIAKLAQDAGGIIGREDVPKKRRLAYPIRHERQGYFGTVQINATPEFAAKLKEGLQHHPTLIRHLLIQQERPKRPSPARVERRPRPTVIETAPAPEAAVATPQQSLEDFDKKIEEILQSGE